MSQDLRDTHRYIVIAGGDGAGKTTLCAALRDRLHTAFPQRPVHVLKFPSHDTAVGRLIQRVFARIEVVSEAALVHLFMADLIECDQRMRRLYADGGFIICDRHPLVDGWVYQTQGPHAHSVDDLLAIQRRANFLAPDRVFVIDTPVELIEERLAERLAERPARNPLFEPQDPAYQESVRQRFVAYAIMHKQHARLLDGMRTVDELTTALFAAIAVRS